MSFFLAVETKTHDCDISWNTGKEEFEVVLLIDTRMSMELSNYLVSWVVTYLGDLHPTYIGVINGYNLFIKFHGHPNMDPQT